MTLEQEYRALREGLRRIEPDAHTFDASSYEPAAVARVRALWVDRTQNEYRSTFVFSALASQLLVAGASLEASAVTLRMAQDELVHAERCAGVAVALGGTPPTLPLTGGVATIAKHANVSREECALRNVVYTTCISEMTAVAHLTLSLERARDPFMRHHIRALLADETLHGRFGFHYLESWADWLGDRPGVRASLTRYLRFAFAVAEREFSWPSRAPGNADDDALGYVAPQEIVEIHRNTMEHAVAPALARFGLDAEEAYRTRTFAP